MEWVSLYSANTQPTPAEIAQYINHPLWIKLTTYLQDNYQVEPKYTYSSCSAQPGWNVKYQKGGKSLCTLYPMDGFFIAMVTIGRKEEVEAELLASTFTEYMQALMKKADKLNGARWLMIEVTDAEILENVKTLIRLRRQIKGGEHAKTNN